MTATKMPTDIGFDQAQTLIDSPAEIERRIRKVFPPAQNPICVIGTFTLKPHKGKSDLKSMVEAGAYDWTNDYITPDRFTEDVIGPVDDEVECVLVQSSKDPESEDILAFAEENGFEQPENGDILRFGEQHPEEQGKHQIVGPSKKRVLGSGGSERVLVLGEGDSKRSLGLDWFDDGWHSGFVLLLRKRKA